MKHLFYLLSILILFGCKNSEETTITGYVTNKVTGALRLSQFGESRMDSKVCELENGQFNFKVNIDNPEQFILIYEENGSQRTYESFSFFIEPSANVKVVLYPDSISKSRITGSEIAEEFSKINQTIDNKYYSKIERLKIKYEEAIKNENKNLQKSIISKADSIGNEIVKWKLDYIENNPESHIAAYFLQSLNSSKKINVDTLKKYYDILGKSLQNSKYYDKIDAFLSTLPGKSYHDFELKDTNNASIQLSNIIQKNKVVLIDFWASWCPPCRKQNPRLAEIYNNYKSKGFEIVGISSDRDTSRFIKTVKEDNMNWINLMDRTDETAVSEMYQIPTVPYYVLINKDGIIIYRDRKLVDLEPKIIKLLNQ